MRVNTLKSSVEDFVRIAKEKNWQLEPVPWTPEAFFVDRVDRETALGKDLLHLMGHVYMQEASSMLPVALLDPQPGEKILDMSAAPGSKTTQMAARMNNTGLIIANDVQEKRLWTLKSALHRLGVTNMIVTKKVGQWFGKNMTGRFDRVLCDAPCTAQGTSRKDSDALDYCSLDNIGKMAKLQRELLEAAIHACKTGGRIVYSTCTLTPEENEDVVRSMLDKFEGQLEVINPLGTLLMQAVEDSLIVQKELGMKPFPAYRVWPQTYDTEGFFCAVFHKLAQTKDRLPFEPVRFQEEEVPQARQKIFGKQLEEKYGTSFLQDGDVIFQRGDQLLLANHPVSKFHMPVQDYSLGMPFAKRLKSEELRLDHEVATLRGHMATKSVWELTDEHLNKLLDGKDTECPRDLRGDVVLIYKGMCVGLGLAIDGVLKNRLPRWVVQKS
ncbi:MAG: rRNA ((5)-)-methyltransferase RsmF [Candidatus Peribacteria bacterium]|nr:rRNA ((5)-)-methyltransferase RsmF [Candidatus Peribacteria bacterium]